MKNWFKFKSTKAREKRAEFIKQLREKGFEVFEYIRSLEEKAEQARLIGELVLSGGHVVVRKASDLDKRLYVFWEHKPIGYIWTSLQKEIIFDYYWDPKKLKDSGDYLFDRIVLDKESEVANEIAQGCKVETSPASPGTNMPQWLLNPKGELKKY